MTFKSPSHSLFLFFTLVLGAAFFLNWNAPLQGVHSIRQSDTVYAAYSYCTERADFLKPRIAHRGLSSGIAIGEFPLYSYILSLPCQIRGGWSEGDVKFFILLFWLLNLWIWTRWAHKYLYMTKLDRASLAILLMFSSFSLLFMTISLPDNLALFLVGWAANISLEEKKSKTWLSTILFVLAFAIRPYFIPLLLLVHRRFWPMFWTAVMCVGVYLVWYKWWVLKSDLQYYYTSLPPLKEVLGDLPHYGGRLLMVFLREMFHYFFVLLLFWKWKALDRRELLGLLGSIALVILARGEHAIVHSYYFWAAAIFIFLCLARTLATLSPKSRLWALVVYALIGLLQTQHEFHRQAEHRSNQLQQLVQESQMPPDAKVAVFVGEGSCSTHYLYWMKHQGWCFYEKEFKGPSSCPEGANYYFRFEGETPILRACGT